MRGEGVFFLLFKQKTAYEMRISDWSSDVCSSDLLGNTPVLGRHFRIVQRLSDYGFFRAGGVLVGTHAFLSFGNMLGVRWAEALRTQDVDFAHAGKALPIDRKSGV